MSEDTADGGMRGVGAATDTLRWFVAGRVDPRFRATWRYLLAAPLVLSTELVVETVMPALGLDGMLPAGLVQAATFAVLLVVWARYVDRRRLTDYGLSASLEWGRDLLVAFGAILVGFGLWYGLGSALGWTTVELSPTAPEGSVVLALAPVFVALAVNVWVQETVFFGIALRNAAEGLHSRGLTSRRAVAGGWLAGVVFFVVIHGASLQRAGLLVASGALFGLLYVHTGELALPIGFHLGVNFVAGWLFAPASVFGERVTVFVVDGTLPALSAVTRAAIPQMLLAYLLVGAWLYWRRGGVGIQADIARWRVR